MGDPDAQSLSISPGAHLQLARVQAGLTVAQVAERLHLDEATIAALESGQLEGLGAAVFVRGHLRHYAELLSVPEEEILAAYDAWSGRPMAMPDLRGVITAPGVRSGARGFELKPLHGLIGAIALVLLALVWWALRQAPASSAKSIAVLAPAPSVATVPKGTAAPTAPVVNPVASAARIVPAVAVIPAPAVPPPSQPPVQPQIHLSVHFSQDSWVEISDGDGTRLFHQLGMAGSRHRVAGSVPLRIFLGDPSAVELDMDGHPLSLTGPGKVRLRRFLLDGDGRMTPEAPASRP